MAYSDLIQHLENKVAINSGSEEPKKKKRKDATDRHSVISFKSSDEEKQLIDNVAKTLGMTREGYARFVTINAARGLLIIPKDTSLGISILP